MTDRFLPQTARRKGKANPVIACQWTPFRREMPAASDQCAPGRLPDPDVDFQLHLETETVEHCHPSKSVCARPSDSVRAVLRALQAQRTGAAMICDDDRKLVGVF